MSWHPLLIYILCCVIFGVSFFLGFYVGKRQTIGQFLQVANDPLYLDIYLKVAKKEFKDEKALQNYINERFTYYKNLNSLKENK